MYCNGCLYPSKSRPCFSEKQSLYEVHRYLYFVLFLANRIHCYVPTLNAIIVFFLFLHFCIFLQVVASRAIQLADGVSFYTFVLDVATRTKVTFRDNRETR